MKLQVTRRPARWLDTEAVVPGRPAGTEARPTAASDVLVLRGMNVLMNATASPAAIAVANRLAWGVWTALLLGHACSFAVASSSGAEFSPLSSVATAVGVLIGALVIGTFARGEVFKRYWVGHAVTPRGYTAGHLLAWTMLAAPSVFAATAAVRHQAAWPIAGACLAAAALHVAMFPRRSAMQPTPPCPLQPYAPSSAR